MVAYEFMLHEHNWNNHFGDVLPEMTEFSKSGWEDVERAIAFPFVYVLWRREVDHKEPEADHTTCQGEQQSLAAERDEARQELEQLRSQAQEVQRQLAESQEHARNLNNEKEQLKGQLVAAQQAAQPPPEGP